MRLLSLLLACSLLQSSAPYADPAGAFAVSLPSGWKAERTELEDDVFLTEFSRPSEETGPQLSVLTVKTGQEIKASDRPAVTEALASVVLSILKADGEVTPGAASEIQIQGRPAKKTLLTCKDSDGVTWKGWMAIVCGKQTAVAVLPYARSADATGLKVAEAAAMSLAVESRTPGKAGAAGSGLLSRAMLQQTAEGVKANFRREPMSKVISAGDPPLTYGSVANFVTVIELLFDIQFTEAEFQATRERFIEYYAKADPKGREILALQGASLLKSATEGSPAEVAQNRAEGKAVFEDAFRRGAEQGMAYAQVMWEAIQRRAGKVATSAKPAAKQGWDTDVSEADLDATLEMLYFMWVASGRSAADVTPEDVMKIRQEIITGFGELSPDVQLVIANAQKVYAGLRQQWQSATPAQRLALSQQFGAALDALGLKEGGSFEEVSGGSGGGGGSDLAAIAQNTAWNAAKTWSSSGS